MFIPYIIVLLIVVIILLCIFPFETPVDSIWGNSIWVLDRNSKYVALTFDDGPNQPYTGQILDILKEKNVKATFFIIGKNVNENSCEVVRRIYSEGHSIGSHSYSNGLLLLDTPGQFAKEVQMCEERFKMCVPELKIRLFRPKTGWRNPFLYMVLRKKHYFYVGWSPWCWAYDWFKRSPDGISRTVLAHVKGGSIIVLHDGKGTTGGYRGATRDALPLIIDGIRKKGFEFITIDEYIRQNK